MPNHKILALDNMSLQEMDPDAELIPLMTPEDEEEMMKKLIFIYSADYDRIVMSSDEEGRIAKYCDGTVIIYNESEFGEYAAQNYKNELESNKCNVLGVVINE